MPKIGDFCYAVVRHGAMQYCIAGVVTAPLWRKRVAIRVADGSIVRVYPSDIYRDDPFRTIRPTPRPKIEDFDFQL